MTSSGGSRPSDKGGGGGGGHPDPEIKGAGSPGPSPESVTDKQGARGKRTEAIEVRPET